jgi:enamine deaminase RidA (YjgF/YER057c/UK114 family)
MSQAVVHGNTVYIAGQVADDTSRSTGGQTGRSPPRSTRS